jgi:putative MATE family efflux protein
VRVLRDDRDRKILRLALPALGTLAIEPLYILVDTAIVGHLGTAPLAGLGIAALVLVTVVGLVTFLEYTVTADVAYAHGANRIDDAKRSATDSLWLSIGLGLIGAAGIGFGARPLCWLIGGRGEVLAASTTYLRISAIGLPFVLFAVLGHGVMRGLNDLRKPLIIVFVANVANVILELLAVYGAHLGIAGSAWSTVVVQIAAGLWFLTVLRPHLLRLAPSWARLKPVLRSGAHLTIRALGMYAVWISSVAIAARIDTPTLAAQQIITQLFTFLALVLDCFAIPAQSLVAGALGAGSVDEALNIGWACNRLSLWAGGGIAVVLGGGGYFIASAFSSDHAVITRATVGFLILAAMQIPGAIAFALDGALIGARDERFLGRRAWYNLVAFIPLAGTTLIWPRLGIAGLWGAQLTWMIVRAWANARRFSSKAWVANH